MQLIFMFLILMKMYYKMYLSEVHVYIYTLRLDFFKAIYLDIRSFCSDIHEVFTLVFRLFVTNVGLILS